MGKFDDYLTISQFSKRVGRSRSFVHRAIKARRLRAEKCDFFYMIHKSELKKHGRL